MNSWNAPAYGTDDYSYGLYDGYQECWNYGNEDANNNGGYT
jgi:hypothetical protein